MPEAEITWYFDPNKKTQSVGEGSTLNLPRNMFANLGFSHQDLRHLDGTFKTGIHKENWGTKNQEFFHDFPPPVLSYHFNAVKLQDYVEKKLENQINIVRESVDYKNLDADFILNASGFPDNFEDFYESEYIPVNSAYITQCYWDAPTFNYTGCVAAKHGWIFLVPLQNRCSVGYLYNGNISTKEEVKEDVQYVFEKYNLTPSDSVSDLSFKNYYKKDNFEEGGRIVSSGNASFFLEPLEATSIATMDMVTRNAFDVWSGNMGWKQANNNYHNILNQIEFVIMMHYAAGSPFKTDFWEYAQERGIKKIENTKGDMHWQNMYDYVKHIPSVGYADYAVDDYGLWWTGSFVQNIMGLGIENLLAENFGS